MELGEGEGVEGASGGHRTRLPIPLNSKRLTAAHLKRLATALDVPTTAAGDEVRQMVEGKLTDQGREPRNVQVVLGTTPLDAFVLQDADGTFLTVDAEEAPDEESQESDLESEDPDGDVRALRTELETMRAENEGLRRQVDKEKSRVRELWRTNCECLADYDQLIAQQEAEIRRLRGLLSASSSRADSPVSDISTTSHSGEGDAPRVTARRSRRGKAPPVDSFTGEDTEVRLDDWLPSLKRASMWNEWTDEELLLQLAGHLRGRALQEWGLIEEESKNTFASAVESLRTRLDPGGRTLAAQDFRHTRQEESEPVASFIRRLKRTFQVAYGHDRMSAETRDTLLHGQLQEGLRDEIMRAPAVSGAPTYKELCLTSKNEEKRLIELRKRRGYHQPPKNTSRIRAPEKPAESKGKKSQADSSGSASQDSRKCFVCHRTGHLARDCTKRTESRGRKNEQPSSKQVTTTKDSDTEPDQSDILEMLFSSSDESEGNVDVVRVPDHGSSPRRARVGIQGVPALGVVDSGSDITIMGGNLLRKVAAVARLKKKDLKPPDKSPRNYDRRPFKLHGRIDMTISFAGRMLTTPVYIKMDAEEPLLLSEGVCRQLGIIQYHPDVEVQPPKERRKAASTKNTDNSLGESPDKTEEDPVVPAVSVRLVQSLRLPPGHCAVVQVEVDGVLKDLPQMLEPDPSVREEWGLELTESVLEVSEEGRAHVVVTNNSGWTLPQTLC